MDQTLDLGLLEHVIGVRFQNRRLLLAAVTHRSYLNEHRQEKAQHNERLEFLGDAILEAIVTHHLFKTVQEDEGRLTNIRAVLVKTTHLSAIGESLGLGRFIRMNHGQREDFENGHRSRGYILACTVEALIGAIFLERGYGVAELFVHHFILPRLNALADKDIRDPKSMLQEVTQEREGIAPHYRVLSVHGADHEQVFKIGIYLDGRLVASGEGPSKALASTNAATRALKLEYNLEPEV